jgi:hypothetical protein
VRDQFLVEIEAAGGVCSLDDLNRLFTAWLHQLFTDRKRADYASDLR